MFVYVCNSVCIFIRTIIDSVVADELYKTFNQSALYSIPPHGRLIENAFGQCKITLLIL